MGTLTLKKQHEIDQRSLFNFLGENFSAQDFFPKVNLQDKQSAYIVYFNLGTLFANWESYLHSDNYYLQAYKINKKFFSFANLMRMVGTKFFNESLNKNVITILFRRLLRKIFR